MEFKKKAEINSVIKIFLEWACIITPFLFSFIFLCFYAKTRLQQNIYPIGDLAADMLLSNQINSKGYLLTGQYSRFEFHHPGPFFFYLTYLFEKIGSFFLLSRAASWTLAMIFINSAFLSISAWLAFKSSLHLLSDLIKRLMFTFVALYYLKDFAISVWPPDKIVIPFMTFILTLPYILKRDFRYFPISILMGSILFHGRVDSPIFTFIPLLCLMGYAFYRNRGSLSPSERGNLLFGVGIGLLFLIPIFVDLVINQPSNLSLIINSMHHLKSDSSTWKEVYKYCLNYWKEAIGIIVSPFAAIIIFKDKKIAEDFYNQGLLFISFFETIIFLLYFKSAPPPLYNYMAEFYVVIPIILFSRPAINALENLSIDYCQENGAKKSLEAVLANALIGVVPVILIVQMTKMVGAPIWDQNKDIPRLTAEIMKLTKSSQYIRIEHPHSMWPIVSGILLEFSKDHQKACSTFYGLSFLFTPAMTCNPDKKANIKLMESKECSGKCTSIIGNIGLKAINMDPVIQDK